MLVDGIACRLEGQQQAVAIFGGDGVLHFVDDEDNIGIGLLYDGRERLCQRGALLLAQGVQREAEFETQRPHIHALHARQCLEQARGAILQIQHGLAHGGMDQRGR